MNPQRIKTRNYIKGRKTTNRWRRTKRQNKGGKPR